MIGVLDGPQLNQTRVLRLRAAMRPTAVAAAVYRSMTTPDGTTLGRARVRSPVGDLRAFGFGSVPVLFETPPGYLLGFRDYLNILADAQHRHAGRADAVRRKLWCQLHEDDTTPPIPFFRLADDIDEDGICGRRSSSSMPDGNVVLHLHRLRRPAQIQHLLRQRDGSQHARRPTASKPCGRTTSRISTTWPSTRTTG